MTCKYLASLVWLGLVLAQLQPCAQYNMLGAWSETGVPEYLHVPNDEINLQLWEDLNLALPERQPVPDYNPEYLDSDNQLNLVFSETTDVYMTFVHEGAGWKNSLAYYTYDEDDVPESPDDLQLTLVFPNSSYDGSGGGLESGNKVLLGTFDEGTVLGFALVARGWQPESQTVENNLYTVFSQSNFNPENNANLQQHVVALKDDIREMVFYGFEDINRQWSSCDHDFNDAIFYMTFANYDAVETEDVLEFPNSSVSCFSVPENLGASEIKLYKATASWEGIEGADEYRIRFRKWNSEEDWEYRNAGADTSFVLGELIPLHSSTYYEWQVAVTCDDLQTHNSVKHVFKTLTPCDMPSGLQVQNIQANSAELHWAPVPNIDHYVLRYREVGDESWEWRNCGSDLEHECVELDPNTTYEWSVNSFCTELTSCFAPYGSHFLFTTLPEGQIPPQAPSPECDDLTNYAHWDTDQIFAHNHQITDWQIIDVDSDGHEELYFISDTPGIHSGLLADGAVESIETIIPNLSLNSIEVRTHDRQVEILASSLVNDEILIWQESATGMWDLRLHHTQISTPTDASWIGENTFAVQSQGDEQIHLLEFTRESRQLWITTSVANEGVPLNHGDLASVDFDNNGSKDMLYLTPSQNALGLCINRLEHDTMPLISASYPLDMRPTCVATCDLNQDGLEDLVIGSHEANAVTILQNISAPDQLLFEIKETLFLEGSPSSIGFLEPLGLERGQLLVGLKGQNSLVSYEILDHSEIVFTEEVLIPISAPAQAIATTKEEILIIHELGFETLEKPSFANVLKSTTIGEGVSLHVEGDQAVDHYVWYVEDSWGKTKINPGTGIQGAESNNLILEDQSLYTGSTLVCEMHHGACGTETTILKKFIPPTAKGYLHLFPNPTHDFINMEYNHRDAGEFVITMVNSEGQRMMEQWFERDAGLFEIRFDVRVYNPGIYFLTVSNSRQTHTERFVIN